MRKYSIYPVQESNLKSSLKLAELPLESNLKLVELTLESNLNLVKLTLESNLKLVKLPLESYLKLVELPLESNLKLVELCRHQEELHYLSTRIKSSRTLDLFQHQYLHKQFFLSMVVQTSWMKYLMARRLKRITLGNLK